MSLSQDDVKMFKLVTMATAVAEAIEALCHHMGPYPEGKLYANLASTMSLDTFNAIMALLKRANMITINNHLITWTGPKRDGTPQTSGEQHH